MENYEQVHFQVPTKRNKQAWFRLKKQSFFYSFGYFSTKLLGVPTVGNIVPRRARKKHALQVSLFDWLFQAAVAGPRKPDCSLLLPHISGLP